MRHWGIACLLLVACGDGSVAKIRMTPNIVAGSSTGASSDGKVSATSSALRIGSPGAAQLMSLKYYVTSIQLCQWVDQMGTAFSAAEGCISLYDTPDMSPDYNDYTVSDAQHDDAPGRFVDLMTAEGQALLRHPKTLEIPVADPDAKEGEVPKSQAGVYRFGLINFYRPIRVTAEFPILGGSGDYFRTRAVTNIHEGTTGDGQFNTASVEIDDTLSGPTEETTYMLDNGGSLFTFQKPFSITQEDVDAQAEIKIDLVFNPENFGQAYDSAPCDVNASWTKICDPKNSVVIDMPYVRMNPVPRKAGEQTRKETYLMDYDTSSKLRIELYYNDADEEAGIQGVDSAVVYMGMPDHYDNNVIASNFVSQTGSVTSDDASVTLMDYKHDANLEGLIRRHDGAVTIHCLFPGSVCPTAGGSVMRNYTFVGDTLVSSD
jgi:hypothetical protein